MPIIYQEQRNEIQASKKELESELMRIVNEWENKTGVSVSNIQIILQDVEVPGVPGGKRQFVKREISMQIAL